MQGEALISTHNCMLEMLKEVTAEPHFCTNFLFFTLKLIYFVSYGDEGHSNGELKDNPLFAEKV